MKKSRLREGEIAFLRLSWDWSQVCLSDVKATFLDNSKSERISGEMEGYSSQILEPLLRSWE